MKFICDCGKESEYDETKPGRPRQYCDDVCTKKYSYRKWRQRFRPYKKDPSVLQECPRCHRAFRQTEGRGNTRTYCGSCK